MPCYTVQTMSVEMKAANRDLLEKALKAEGIRYTRSGDVFTIYTNDGNITISKSDQANLRGSNLRGLQETLNQIKRGYSHQVIQEVARRKKMVMKTTPNKRTGVLFRG